MTHRVEGIYGRTYSWGLMWGLISINEVENPLFITITNFFFLFLFPWNSLMYLNLASHSLCRRDDLDSWSSSLHPNRHVQPYQVYECWRLLKGFIQAGQAISQLICFLGPLIFFLRRTLLKEKPRHKKSLVSLDLVARSNLIELCQQKLKEKEGLSLANTEGRSLIMFCYGLPIWLLPQGLSWKFSSVAAFD